MTTKWKNKDLSTFLDRLTMYLGAGISLEKAIHSSSQGFSKAEIMSLECARIQVLEGYSLSKSLSLNIKTPKIVTGLLEQGELTGNLSNSILQAKNLLDEQEELKASLLTALLYPIVIASFALVITLGLMVGIMPQITPMLKSLNIDLPLLTKIVIWVSESIVSYGLIFAVGSVLVFSILSFVYKKYSKLAFIVHKILMRIPLIGKLVIYDSVAIFLGAFGRLLESGMSIGEAYERSCELVLIIPLKLHLQSSSFLISRGKSVSRSIDPKSIPVFVLPLIDAGEASGRLDSSLVRSSEIIQKEMSRKLKRLTALLEPTMMVAMGVVIGAIVLSIMMPIYDISKTLQK